MRYGGYWLAAALGMGVVQAWDSGAFSADGMVAGLTIAGILIPAISIPARVHHGVRFAALAIGMVLLVWARMIAPEALNTLHLALFPSMLAILFVGGQSWAHHPAKPKS